MYDSVAPVSNKAFNVFPAIESLTSGRLSVRSRKSGSIYKTEILSSPKVLLELLEFSPLLDSLSFDELLLHSTS